MPPPLVLPVKVTLPLITVITGLLALPRFPNGSWAVVVVKRPVVPLPPWLLPMLPPWIVWFACAEMFVTIWFNVLTFPHGPSVFEPLGPILLIGVGLPV